MGKSHKQLQYVMVNAISNTTENAVTSIRLSVFDPTGWLLVAFDDGKVRLWKSSMKSDVVDLFNDLKRKNKKSK